MTMVSSVSQTSIRLKGMPIPGATDRHQSIPGFDQKRFSSSTVCCIGAGGLISHIAPTLVRKGIGRISFLDRDIVEPSNLNRQRFYPKDIGKNKAVALTLNLQRECTTETTLIGYAANFEQVVEA